MAACSGASRASGPPADSGEGTSTTTPTFPQVTATTVDRPAPDYSFDGAVAAPRLIDTGVDHVTIVQSLERRGAWLGAHHPDPNLTPDTVAPGTRLFAGYLADLTRLRDLHQRLVVRFRTPMTVTIVSSTADAFTARLVLHNLVEQIYDRTGRVTSERRFAEPTTYLDVVVLARGRWYLAASDEQTEPVVHL